MVTFRIDDIGASSKHFEQYGDIKKFPLANLWFFKRISPFARWAIYDELTAQEWLLFLAIFKDYYIRPIISVTATWVDQYSNLIPFPKKFPQQAQILKNAFQKNEIIIANHGLTHCVVGKHLPKLWGSNRKYHREFWPYVDQKIHTEHILKSQEILEDFFNKKITIFIPPGNVWSIKTYNALKNTNINKVISRNYILDSTQSLNDIKFISDRTGFFSFHDRELKLFGENWLLEKINEFTK